MQAARKTVGRNAQTGKPSPQFMRFAPEGGPGCALLAGSITSIKPRPFQIGTREDRARRPCRSPPALQGLSGIGIPNRKPRHVILADDVPFAVSLSFWNTFCGQRGVTMARVNGRRAPWRVQTVEGLKKELIDGVIFSPTCTRFAGANHARPD